MLGRDRWENRYATSAYIFGKEPNAFLKAQAFRLPTSGRALAVADGEGRNGVWLAGQGLDVTSVDYASSALEKARRLADERGMQVAFQSADITAWEWPASAFDVAAAIFIQFAGPPARDVIFAGLKAAVKPGGLLLLEGYRPEQLAYGTGGPSQLENLYTREILEHAFGNWEVLELRSYDAVIEEGCGHSGMSALIDLVARRPA